VLSSIAGTLLALGVVGGLVGMLVQGSIIKSNNSTNLANAISERYGLNLAANQRTRLFTTDVIDGDVVDGKRYGSFTLSRAHAYVDISLFYIDGKWIVGTVGTGQVNELQTGTTNPM